MSIAKNKFFLFCGKKHGKIPETFPETAKYFKVKKFSNRHSDQARVVKHERHFFVKEDFADLYFKLVRLKDGI